MSITYGMSTTPNRQLETLHSSLDFAQRSFMAHFVTATVKIWGIEEKCAGPNRDDLVKAELTLIITLGDRRNRLNRDDMKAVARRELENFVACNGTWSKGRLPAIFDYDSPDLTGCDVWMLSRSTWVAHITVEAHYEDPGLPLGWAEWHTSRGVR